jgi:hypothetical protein
MKKYYDILGLSEGASKEEIQEAYDRLSKELDPQKNGNHEFFLEEYALLQEAYHELTNNSNIIPITSQQKNTISLYNTSTKKPDSENKVKTNKGDNDFFSSNTMISVYIVVVLILILITIQKYNKNSDTFKNSEVGSADIDTTAVVFDTDNVTIDTSVLFTKVEHDVALSGIQFNVKVRKKTIRINEKLQIDFSFNFDGDNFIRPDFKNFKIIAGPSQQISQSWINGRSSFLKSYSYFLLPLKRGALEINQASIEANGQVYKTSSIVINVTELVK